MPRILNTQRLANAMVAEGLLPESCSNVEILIPAAGPMVLRFERFVGVDELERLARAMTAAAATEGEADRSVNRDAEPGRG